MEYTSAAKQTLLAFGELQWHSHDQLARCLEFVQTSSISWDDCGGSLSGTMSSLGSGVVARGDSKSFRMIHVLASKAVWLGLHLGVRVVFGIVYKGSV